MKTHSFRTSGSLSTLNAPRSTLHVRHGFTLIELLVVISIIAILAAMLMPALSRVRTTAKIKQAQLEMNKLAAAIHEYESGNNGRFPVSSNAMVAATAMREDFTFGTAGLPDFATPSGTPLPINSIDSASKPLAYQTNNSEVMAILLDLESYPSDPTIRTINYGHVKNPQRTKYLNATMVGATNQPGVGPDLVFRDPWLNPYIITMDLNYDDKARDSFYRGDKVSGGGQNGLIKHASLNLYEANRPVMIWSAGPDKMIDPNAAANIGVNKDNILSWK